MGNKRTRDGTRPSVRHSPQGDQKIVRFRCPFPNCEGTFAKEDRKHNCCDRHRQFFDDLTFALQAMGIIRKVEPQTEPPPGGPTLFVPKPGQADRAIEEARRARGDRP